MENEKDELIELLFIAEDYLIVHWDMDSSPLYKIKERLLKADAQKLLHTKQPTVEPDTGKRAG